MVTIEGVEMELQEKEIECLGCGENRAVYIAGLWICANCAGEVESGERTHFVASTRFKNVFCQSCESDVIALMVGSKWLCKECGEKIETTPSDESLQDLLQIHA